MNAEETLIENLQTDIYRYYKNSGSTLFPTVRSKGGLNEKKL